jgi:hypothetical protein
MKTIPTTSSISQRFILFFIKVRLNVSENFPVKAIIAAQFLRLLPKSSFYRNNDYRDNRIYFRNKRISVGAFFREKRSENIVVSTLISFSGSLTERRMTGRRKLNVE